MELSEETKRDLMDYQNLQQQLQMIMMQKQQGQLQLAELDRAKEEVSKSTSDTFFRSVGAIFVPKTKAQVLADMAEDFDSVKFRSDMIAKQEERLKSKLSSIQEKLQELESKFSGESGEGASMTSSKKKIGR